MFSKQKTIFLMAHFLLSSFVTFGYDTNTDPRNSFIVNVRSENQSNQNNNMPAGLSEAQSMLPRLPEQNLQIQQQAQSTQQFYAIEQMMVIKSLDNPTKPPKT